MTAGIGGIAQAGASALAATYQYRIGKQAQDRLDSLAKYTLYNLEVDKQRSENFKQCIDDALAEMCATPMPINQTTAIVARGSAVIEAELARATKKARECTSAFCAPYTRTQIAQMAAQAGARKAEMATAEARKEEARVNILKDRRINLKLAVGKVTRGNFDGSIAASRALVDYYNRQVAASGEAINGALRTIGYLAARNFGDTPADVKDRGPEVTDAYRATVNSDFEREVERQRNVSLEEFGGTTPSYQPNESPSDPGIGGTSGTNSGEAEVNIYG